MLKVGEGRRSVLLPGDIERRAEARLVPAYGARLSAAVLVAPVWHQPLPGARAALARLGAAGVRLAVTSNSNGTVADLLQQASDSVALITETVAALRTHFYRQLAPIANRWNEGLGTASRFPATHAEYLERCHAEGQLRPTPLMLRYGAGDYNCLHQDLYGDEVFPLQVAVLLSEPGRDFSGGEFVLTEQRPRRQSRAEVVPLTQGDAVVFAVHHRPAMGSRGWYRVNLRHGISRVRSGRRRTPWSRGWWRPPSQHRWEIRALPPRRSTHACSAHFKAYDAHTRAGRVAASSARRPDA